MSPYSAPHLNALSGTLLVICTLTVCLRFCARSSQKAPLRIDDWILVPCLMFYLGSTLVVFLGVHDRVFGYATASFTTEQIESMAELSSKYGIAWDYVSTATLALSKLSALLFYKRIFYVCDPRALFSVINMITTVIVVLWLVTFCFLPGLQCGTHLSALWTGHKDFDEYCTLSLPYLYGLAVSDMVLDVWILALPVIPVSRLHASLKQRVAVTCVFLLAFIGLAGSVVRMVIVIQIVKGGTEIFIQEGSELLNSKILFYSLLEAGMSIIAVNLPSLWTFTNRKAREKMLHSFRNVLSLCSLHSFRLLRSAGSAGAEDEAVGSNERIGLERLESGSGSGSKEQGRWKDSLESTKTRGDGGDEEAGGKTERGSGVAV